MNQTTAHTAPNPSTSNVGGRKLRVLLSGGGTGGHLYPAIAIAKYIREHYPGSEIMFVGAQGRIEMEKVPAQGFHIEGLPIKGFDRSNLFRNIDLPFKLIICFWKSSKILNKFRPDVVVGTGGYASGPVAYVAAKKNIPVVLQEQNFYPGLTTRLLAPQAKKICVAFENMEKWFPPKKIHLTGNPVRGDLEQNQTSPNEAKETFGLDPQKKTLLVMGGSGGAKTINEAILENLSTFNENDIQVLWQAGEHYFEEMKQKLENSSFGNNVKLQAFIEDMPLAYQAADLVACRAGAITIAELQVCGKPAILIPSPNVVADHQFKNAEAIRDKSAALLIPDQEAIDRLGKESVNLLQNNEELKAMSENIRAMAKPEATQNIVEQIVKSSRKYGH